jgi:hypothetical protein
MATPTARGSLFLGVGLDWAGDDLLGDLGSRERRGGEVPGEGVRG